MDLAFQLRQRGFTVIEAGRVAEAIDLLVTGAFPISLVLTDVQMPGEMDGLDLLRWTREHHPSIVVAVMSASREAVAQALGLCAPSLVFLKPVLVGAMAEVFEAILGEPAPDQGTDVA
jgi:CheY-like chemotaxis protein